MFKLGDRKMYHFFLLLFFPSWFTNFSYKDKKKKKNAISNYFCVFKCWNSYEMRNKLCYENHQRPLWEKRKEKKKSIHDYYCYFILILMGNIMLSSFDREIAKLKSSNVFLNYLKYTFSLISLEFLSILMEVKIFRREKNVSNQI